MGPASERASRTQGHSAYSADCVWVCALCDVSICITLHATLPTSLAGALSVLELAHEFRVSLAKWLGCMQIDSQRLIRPICCPFVCSSRCSTVPTASDPSGWLSLDLDHCLALADKLRAANWQPCAPFQLGHAIRRLLPARPFNYPSGPSGSSLPSLTCLAQKGGSAARERPRETLQSEGQLSCIGVLWRREGAALQALQAPQASWAFKRILRAP